MLGWINQAYAYLRKQACCVILTGEGGGPFHCPGPVIGGGWTVGPYIGTHKHTQTCTQEKNTCLRLALHNQFTNNSLFTGKIHIYNDHVNSYIL